jgi:RNA polymerase sigma factor (sigma-70 family)
MKGADLDEIEALYRARFQAFVRTAAAICGDVETGRDVVQEAFAAAVRERAKFRRESALEAWIWPIVLNKARDRARRPTEAPPVSADLATDGHEPESHALRIALAALPERQRLAIFLRYYADLDYDAIARVLGVSPGTVGATLNAAHVSLRKRLEEVAS